MSKTTGKERGGQSFARSVARVGFYATVEYLPLKCYFVTLKCYPEVRIRNTGVNK